MELICNKDENKAITHVLALVFFNIYQCKLILGEFFVLRILQNIKE